MSTLERIERICRRGAGDAGHLDDRALRAAVLAELRTAVPTDAHVWVTTDPATGVGVSPLADVPSIDGLPALIRARYLATGYRWTTWAAGTATTLASGDDAGSGPWRRLLAAHGVDDVVSTVCRDRHGCWAFLDLWRRGGRFTAAERDLVGAVGRVATPALRRSLARTFVPEAGGPVPAPLPLPPDGPVVLLLGDDLTLLTQTPATDAHLRALLPTGPAAAPVPAAAYNVGAQLLAREQGVDDQPPRARVHVRDGLWVTLHAARMAGPAPVGDGAPAPAIAVGVEPTPPAERADLYARVLGLTGREAELLQHLVAGCDTRELADRLHVSGYTVQDHLKAIFAKTGTGNRRALVARATGTVPSHLWSPTDS